MKVAVLKERRAGETRVAATPETVKKLIGMGCTADAKNLFAIDLTGAKALVLGAEGKGLRQLTLKHCDYVAKIPMLGQIESLNVSVAAGVCLFEAIRQRNKW